MGLKNRQGVDMCEVWKDGIRSYTGMTFAGFPNVFMSYTAFAPTALSNGPTIIEVQCDFACEAIRKILASEKEGGKPIKSVEALSQAEDEWAAYVDAQSAPTLFPLTDSWWNATNIPGKKPQMLTYLLGIGQYEKEIRERLDAWQGFDVRYWDGEGQTRTANLGAQGLAYGAKSDGPVAEHVEHAGVDAPASEAADILRPSVATH